MKTDEKKGAAEYMAEAIDAANAKRFADAALLYRKAGNMFLGRGRKEDCETRAIACEKLADETQAHFRLPSGEIDRSKVLASEDANYFVIAPLCWGKGKTLQEAKKNARKNFSRSHGKFRVLDAYRTLDATAFMDSYGGFNYIPELTAQIDVAKV